LWEKAAGCAALRGIKKGTAPAGFIPCGGMATARLPGEGFNWPAQNKKIAQVFVFMPAIRLAAPRGAIYEHDITWCRIGASRRESHGLAPRPTAEYLGLGSHLQRIIEPIRVPSSSFGLFRERGPGAALPCGGLNKEPPRRVSFPAGGWRRHTCQAKAYSWPAQNPQACKEFVYMPAVRLAEPRGAFYEHDLHGAALEPPAANHTAWHHAQPPNARGLAAACCLNALNSVQLSQPISRHWVFGLFGNWGRRQRCPAGDQ